ncbi:cation:proton antiporter [candidate division WWE3 bacterium]|nr:cation:proton antiporter [candidate division WWE3 bacterium]
MDSILLELGAMMGLALVFGFLCNLIKLPSILGYIIAGFISTLLFPSELVSNNALELFSTLGVALLLFMIGIEMNIRELHEVGPAALITGFGQVSITYIAGLLVAKFLLGYDFIEASYISIALTFSSTIIVIKLLGEKGDLNSLYGRLSLGVLIVQDLFAVVSLIGLNALAGGDNAGQNVPLFIQLINLALAGVLLIPVTFVLGRLMTLFMNFMGKSTELILLAALSWALLFALITERIGFSIEVGAFLAGIGLASSPLSVEIASKIKPLRDFFIVIFFVVLGMGIKLSSFAATWDEIAVFSILVLIGNPLILLAVMGAMGYHRRISFLTGLTVSQVSEFSLILMGAGVAFGQVRPESLAIVTGVAVITIVGSSYLISHSDELYRYFDRFLVIFQRKHLRHQRTKTPKPAEVLLFGAHRMGSEILRECLDQKIRVLVVDYDPVTVRQLDSQDIPVILGDLSDPELIPLLDLNEVKAIISTVPSDEDTLFLLSQVSMLPSKHLVIVRAEDHQRSQLFRKHGADHALVPELLAGERVASLLIRNGILEAVSKEK